MQRSRTVLTASLLGSLMNCAWGAAADAIPMQESMAIEHVTVLAMTADGAALPDRTVVIRDGRIESITPSRQVGRLRVARHVDGRGRWLLPGLTDMHVHLENARMLRLVLNTGDAKRARVDTADALLPYLANGVTQILDLNAMSETIGQRLDVAEGRILGPRIVAAAMVDGPNPMWPVGTTRVAASPHDGRQAVRDVFAEGYDAIKLYSNLDLATFSAMIDEARKLKLPVVGHIPGRQRGTTAEFLQPGFGLVAHAEEFAQQTALPSPAAIPEYVVMMKRSGAWLASTLSLDERILEATVYPGTLQQRSELRVLHPLWRDYVINHNPYVAVKDPARVGFLKQIVEFNRQLVLAFMNAGIPIVAGTDSPVPGLAPGYAMQDEVGALVRAGMTNRQALESATRMPCEWLGPAAQCGTVQPGKRADLLLLDANPEQDVGNLRRIQAVIVAGRYVPGSFLQRRIGEIAARN